PRPVRWHLRYRAGQPDHLPAPPGERQHIHHEPGRTSDLGGDRACPCRKAGIRGQGRVQSRRSLPVLQGKGQLRKRAEYNLELARYDFEMPALLGDNEVAAILTRADELVSWAGDFKDYALQKALSGTKFTGFKVVEGRSNRK